MNIDLYQSEYRAAPGGPIYHISAGGVVYKKFGNEYKFLLLGRRNKAGTIVYHLPKGTLHVGETLEHCAVREIAEEAGVVVLLKSYIGGRHAVFDYEDVQYDKIIHYFIASYVQEAGEMDDEHDFRQWFTYDEAVTKLQAHVKSEDVFVTRCKEYLSTL